MKLNKLIGYSLLAMFFVIGAAFSASYCQIDDLTNLTMLSGLGAIITAVIIALGYMVGEFLQNPRIIVWAKIELGQFVVSMLLLILIVACLDVFACSLKFGDVKQFTGITGDLQIATLGISDDANLIDASKAYSLNLVKFNKDVLTKIRFNIGRIELRAGFSRWQCGQDEGMSEGKVFSCLIGGPGFSKAEYSGEYSISGVLSALLNTTTASYLSAIFILFTLEFLTNGLFMYFLPLGIMLRSIPFMRGFGGALIALVLVMYIGYPVMLVADMFLWYPSYTAMGVGSALGPAVDEESPFGAVGGVIDAITSNPPEYQSISGMIFLSSTSFFATMFLPAINFIVLAALAKSVSQLIGDEIDISRLSQMV